MNIFKANLQFDLKLRGISFQIDAQLNDLRSLLLSQLELEWDLQGLKKKLEYCDSISEKKKNALYGLLDAIPCILHLENRISLKIVEMLIRAGLDNAKMNLLSWLDPNRTEFQRMED